MPIQKSRSKIIFLLLIILFHLLPIFVSAYYDIALHPGHREVMKLTDIKYWLWFFTWWSAWASLLTILWAIYKLFNLKKSTSTYNEQLIDLMVTETNLISGWFFCLGGFLLTIPSAKHPTIIYPLLGEVKTIYVWLFYNLFWHVLAPNLVLYYFWKYCHVDKIERKKKISLFANLINPTIYFFYVVLRPLVANLPKLGGNNLPHRYPRDYPYPLFFWGMGKSASSRETKVSSFFWHNWPTQIQILFWTATIFILSYLGFSLIFYFLLWLKKKFRGRKSILFNKTSK